MRAACEGKHERRPERTGRHSRCGTRLSPETEVEGPEATGAERKKEGRKWLILRGTGLMYIIPIIILMTLTPLSELDELIRAGWGDTPQTCIPKDWRERKRAVNTPTRETHYLHGTLTSYRKGGCRCSACCAASSEYYRRTTEERKRA